MTNEPKFAFTAFEKDIEHGSIRFHYKITKGEEEFSFSEELTFAPPAHSLSSSQEQGISQLAKYLHLALGMSYWKLFCPKTIELPYLLSAEEAQYFKTLYTKGLGEFFYKNKIDFRDLISFPSDPSVTTAPISMKLSDRSLVLSGAGKDSIVTGELLKKHNKTFSLFTLNPTAIHQEVASIMGASNVSVKRTIDPLLMELNKQPDAHNGHIPITSIFMFTALFAAVLYDYRFVIASNEESANYGNVEYLGETMNHQWSKSLEHEELLSSLIRSMVSEDLVVFSLLRPWKEFVIANAFSKHPQYFHAFTSCNTNFKITGDPKKGQWCGACPKCAFVFLLLAASLPKKRVVGIFQKNLLADVSLLPTYKELLGLEGFKPFECVGTPEESHVALALVIKNGEWNTDAVVEELSPMIQNKTLADMTTMSKAHHVPKDLLDVIEGLT